LKVFNRPDEAIRREIIDEVIVGQFMMDPARFFIQVHEGVAVIEGRVEQRSLVVSRADLLLKEAYPRDPRGALVVWPLEPLSEVVLKPVQVSASSAATR
jgi:hypothetical protein